jgi:hypothetical protein
MTREELNNFARQKDAMDGEPDLHHPVAMELFRLAATDDLDTVILRFLRARKWRIEQAFAMLVECMVWRIEFKVDEMLKVGEAGIKTRLLACGKGFAWGEDLEGRLVCYLRARYHDKNAQALEDSMRHAVYCLELGRRLRRHDEQLVTVVVDLQGSGIAAFDLPFVQFMFKCLQSYYPEILGSCLILNAPWIFWGFWAMVKGLLDPVVAAKVQFIKGYELTDYVGRSSIPLDFGGTSPFRFHYRKPPTTELKPVDIEELERLKILEVRFTELCKELDQRLTLQRVKDEKSSENPTLQELTKVMSERDRIKMELRRDYYRLLLPCYPLTMYHQWGVFDKLGRVDWSLYRPEHNAEDLVGRLSAPPPHIVTAEQVIEQDDLLDDGLTDNHSFRSAPL